MDINLMVLNVGNTRLAVGAFVAGTLEKVLRVPLGQSEQCKAAIDEVWGKVRGCAEVGVAGASVNPSATETVAAQVEGLTGKKVEWVGRELELPIRVLTEPPEETGVDRVVNVAAAHEQMGKACVVVDAGTAVTVSFCNDKGDFIGGGIAPGAALMLGALHQGTAKLPKVEMATPEGVYGKSTTEAMRHGVFNAIRGMVKEMVENYATALGAWPELIATGGDAAMLFGGWELVHAVAPDLTLYGVALAYTEHHIRHGT